MSHVPPIKVNRAPVLTLWAAVVAERLGHPPDLALTLGQTLAGAGARAKARRLGISEERDRQAEKREHELRPAIKPVHLLGRDIRILATPDGELRADKDGKPVDPDTVRRYLQRAFGDRLGEARAAMDDAAAMLPAAELNRVGFRMYEAFRPEVPEGVAGWGAKGMLHLGRIFAAASAIGPPG